MLGGTLGLQAIASGKQCILLPVPQWIASLPRPMLGGLLCICSQAQAGQLCLGPVQNHPRLSMVSGNPWTACKWL